jgi:hypothetical protein
MLSYLVQGDVLFDVVGVLFAVTLGVEYDLVIL